MRIVFPEIFGTLYKAALLIIMHTCESQYKKETTLDRLAVELRMISWLQSLLKFPRRTLWGGFKQGAWEFIRCRPTKETSIVAELF